MSQLQNQIHRLSYWWGLPLLFAAILLPFSLMASPYLLVGEGEVFLLFLPLAISVSLLMIFSWRVFPSLAIVSFVLYIYKLGLLPGAWVALAFTLSLGICWYSFLKHVGNRWSCGFGRMQTMLPRLFWIVVVLPLVFLLLIQIAVALGVFIPVERMAASAPFSIRTLISYQALILACLSGVPMCYYLLRVAIKPRFIRVIVSRCRKELAQGVSAWEIQLWLVLLVIMLVMLCIPANDSTNIFFTDYTVTLLLPLMLFGAMRYGYQLTSLVWSASVITLLINYDGFVQWDNLAHSLALIMSMMVMFTLTIILMAAVNTRQRRLYIKTQRASMIDPVIQLPNLRCLHHDLKQHERSVVCFLRIANLDTLCRTYGMQLRLEYKQRLASMMKKVMANNEGVYQLPSYDLVLRLNNKSATETLKRLNDAMKAFRLLWNGLPLRLHYGIGYCTVRQPLEHIYTIIGELSSMAERSLITGNAESTHLNAQTLQEGIHSKVAMLHHIQNGLDKDRFMLMAQPIEGFRGDRYYEVLLRLQDEHGNIIMPNDFFPVVQEFGLNYDVDLWVLNNTLAFINENRERLPAVCFAINLTPSTLARPTLVQDIARILAQYQVEPYQIILEITESNITQTKELTSKTLSQLRQMGCRIAIDDFGTGFASDDRLKHIEADILKIDGSFVRQLMDSPIDQQIVSAMCQIARLKKLLVVAEYVEDEAQKFQLKALGVDYIQGYLLGKPQPLSSL